MTPIFKHTVFKHTEFRPAEFSQPHSRRNRHIAARNAGKISALMAIALLYLAGGAKAAIGAPLSSPISSPSPASANALAFNIALFNDESEMSGDYGQIRLIDAGQNGEGSEQAQWLALELSLREGWKTYWRRPGQNGLDPELGFEMGGKPVSAQLFWPSPKLIGEEGLEAIGYAGTLTLPIHIAMDAGERSEFVKVEGVIGICEQICIPLEISLKTKLRPSSGPGTSREFARIEAIAREAPHRSFEGESGRLAEHPPMALDGFEAKWLGPIEGEDREQGICQWDKEMIFALGRGVHWLFESNKSARLFQINPTQIARLKLDTPARLWRISQTGVQLMPCP